MSKETRSDRAPANDKIHITGTVEVTLVNPTPEATNKAVRKDVDPAPIYADAAVVTIDAGTIYRARC